MKYLRGRIIDGSGREAIEDGIVAIKGARIAAVGPAGSFTEERDQGWVDLGGATILPGIIDAHVHVGPVLEARRGSLRGGVTSLGDLGATMEETAVFKAAMEHKGAAIGRGFCSGPFLTAPGGLPGALFQAGLNQPVGTAAEVQVAVADLAAAGVDFIKVYLDPWLGREFPVLRPDLLKEIVVQAHRMGLLVRAHVNKIAMLKIALEAGVDVLEHVPLPFPVGDKQALSAPVELHAPPRFFTDQLAVLNALLPDLADRGIAMVPTLSKLETTLHGTLIPEPLQPLVFQNALETVKAFHDLGGRVALGTDRNARWEKPLGMPLREMELLLQAGLSPLDVIRAGTAEAAYVCGQAAQLGTLETGKLADLIIVDRDPLMDVHVLGKVSGVYLGGKEIDF